MLRNLSIDIRINVLYFLDFKLNEGHVTFNTFLMTRNIRNNIIVLCYRVSAPSIFIHLIIIRIFIIIIPKIKKLYLVIQHFRICL